MKINDSFSSWSEILFGVPQGSILGPLLFSIFICDIFYSIVNFENASYADDSTPFSAKQDGRSVVDQLEVSSLILFTRQESSSVIWHKKTLQLILMEAS